MIEIEWDMFQVKYMPHKEIFVVETDSTWELYCASDIWKLHCSVEKMADQAENMMFIERYFQRPNIIKVSSVDTDQEEFDDDIIDDDLELKHKYIRRVGKPGSYRYFYRQSPRRQEAKPLERREESLLTDKDFDEIVDGLGDNYDEAIVKYRTSKYKLVEGLNKQGKGLEGRYEIMKELSKKVYDKFDSQIQNSLLAAPKRYDPSEVSSEDISRWRAAISTTSEALRDLVRDKVSGSDERMKIIQELRDKTGNDTTKVNKVLGYMGFTERVKKDGLRGKSMNKKTKEEVSSTLEKNEHNGVKYNISPGMHTRVKEKVKVYSYDKGSSGKIYRDSEGKLYMYKTKKMFESKEEYNSFIKKSLDRLPPKTAQQLAKTNTEINFVTKAEEKTLRQAYRGVGSRTAGIYDPNTKQVYIYTSSFESTTSLDPEKLKEDGISEDAIKKLTSFDNKENYGQIIIHEVGHAITLNLAGKGNRISPGESSPIEKKWDEMQQSDKYKQLDRKLTFFEKDDRYISRYARTNDHEDMAETFAFYARYRPFMKEAVEKNKKWINPVLAEKFKFMEKLWK